MSSGANFKETKSSNLLIYLLLVMIITLSGVVFLLWDKYRSTEKNGNQVLGASSSKSSEESASNSSFSSSVSSSQTVQPDSIRLNTLFFGDVFWGRYVDDWSKASPLKYSYPFSGLSTFERQNYDAWIADLECPITSTYSTSKTQDSLLKFSCPTEYTAEAAKWFSAFTLANNHTDNMQEVDGFTQTKDNLEKNGIQYFGSFDNANKQDICEILSFKSTPVFPKNTVNNDQVEYYIPVALCGYHNVFKLPTQEELAVIKTYSQYLPTIVMPHQGKEYTYKADQLQTTYYRQMIDLGADAVIGDHVHSVQNTEAYKGKLIIYSLGNFIFDQQRGAQVTQAVGANLDFSFTFDKNLEGWIKLGKDCKIYKDNCLVKAKELQLTKPSFTIKYDLVCSDNSGKLAKKASDTVCKNLYKLTNWDQTIKGLK